MKKYVIHLCGKCDTMGFVQVGNSIRGCPKCKTYKLIIKPATPFEIFLENEKYIHLYSKSEAKKYIEFIS